MPKNYDATFTSSAKETARTHVMLYRLTPQVGSTIYVADFDKNITGYVPATPGGAASAQTFLALGTNRKKTGKMTSGAELKVGEFSMSVPNGLVFWNGVNTKLGFLAIAGAFDEAKVDVFIWNASNPNGTCPWHSTWYVMDIAETRTAVTFKCESIMTFLKRQIPRTFMAELCNNQLFDVSCGLLRATFQSSGSVLAGSSATSILWTPPTAAVFVGQTPTPNQAGYFNSGEIVFTSGVNANLKRAIATHSQSGTTATLALLYQFPYAPAVGDTFTIVPGCDKLKATCIAKFNNLLGQGGIGGYRGFDAIPKPEAAF